MNDMVKKILQTYCEECKVEGMTSQDICDSLKDTVKLEVNDVTEHLLASGYKLRREDERLVWTER